MWENSNSNVRQIQLNLSIHVWVQDEAAPQAKGSGTHFCMVEQTYAHMTGMHRKRAGTKVNLTSENSRHLVENGHTVDTTIAF